MQTQAQSLREKTRRSFEARRNDHKARLAFLQDAQILDANGDYNQKFFSRSQSSTSSVRVK